MYVLPNVPCRVSSSHLRQFIERKKFLVATNSRSNERAHTARPRHHLDTRRFTIRKSIAGLVSKFFLTTAHYNNAQRHPFNLSLCLNRADETARVILMQDNQSITLSHCQSHSATFSPRPWRRASAIFGAAPQLVLRNCWKTRNVTPRVFIFL